MSDENSVFALKTKNAEKTKSAEKTISEKNFEIGENFEISQSTQRTKNAENLEIRKNAEKTKNAKKMLKKRKKTVKKRVFLKKSPKILKFLEKQSSKKQFSLFGFSKSEVAIFLIVLGLVCFGCVMVFSASFYAANHRYGNAHFFLIKQIFGVVLGLAAMIFFSLVDYHVLKKFRFWVLGASVLLLVLVFVPGLGVQSYGANRWVNFLGVSIQPSEIAKFALVLFLACYLSEHHSSVKTFRGLIVPLCAAGLLCVLVIIEPSMSVTMCLGFVTLFMLVIGGMSKRHTLLFSSAAAAAVPVLIFAEPYRLKRLFAFLNPWASPQGEGFQLIQSLYGLGNGGWFGVGLFQSRQKFLFLPFAESDFIFSVIGEELGFVGCLCLLAAFFALVWLLFKVALGAKDRFGCLLAAGVGIVIAVQTLLNVAVVTGSIPPTGLPLPFISSGGTSIAVFMAAVGVAISVGRQSRKQ